MQQTPSPQSIKRRLKGEFRWGIVGVLLALLLAAWLASGARPGLSWEDVMDFLHVKNRERYTQLGVLGVILCATLGIARVLSRKKGE